MSIRKGQVIVAGAGSTRRNIGEVYYSQSSLATDNSGALPLWTGESVATAMYPSLTEWVTKHTELQCTAEEYESALSTYGECPKYVLSADSLRLPKLANYVKMANAIDGITQSEAGLPNITGTLSGAMHTGGNAAGGFATGAFAKEARDSNYSYNGGAWVNNVSFDASRSSEVYGKSDTVTPAHTTLYPWVYAYSAVIPSSTAQASEFQEGLSGKADTNLGNIPANYDYVVETYNDGTNWYRVYKSGWVVQGGRYETAVNVESYTFLKPFAEIPTIIASPSSFSRTSYNDFGIDIYNLTTTGFTKQCLRSVGTGWGWRAEGQGA